MPICPAFVPLLDPGGAKSYPACRQGTRDKRSAAGANPSLLILAGDGIGPEVMAEVKKVIGWFGDKRGITFDVSEDLVGGCAYDAHGTPRRTAIGFDGHGHHVVKVYLTEEGAELLRATDKPLDRKNRSLLGDLSDTKLQSLSRLLDEARCAIEAEE